MATKMGEQNLGYPSSKRHTIPLPNTILPSTGYSTNTASRATASVQSYRYLCTMCNYTTIHFHLLILHITTSTRHSAELSALRNTGGEISYLSQLIHSPSLVVLCELPSAEGRATLDTAMAQFIVSTTAMTGVLSDTIATQQLQNTVDTPSESQRTKRPRRGYKAGGNGRSISIVRTLAARLRLFTPLTSCVKDKRTYTQNVQYHIGQPTSRESSAESAAVPPIQFRVAVFRLGCAPLRFFYYHDIENTVTYMGALNAIEHSYNNACAEKEDMVPDYEIDWDEIAERRWTWGLWSEGKKIVGGEVLRDGSVRYMNRTGAKGGVGDGGGGWKGIMELGIREG